MKTRALILALPLVAVAACRDNRASVAVQAICAVPDTCKFSAGACDAVYIGYPTIDASITDSLMLFIQVANQLPDVTNLSSGKVNTNDAHVDQTVVDFEGPALPQAVLQTNMHIPTNGTTVIGVEVIPAILNGAAALRAYAPSGLPERDMVANLRLRGYFDDGSRFETGQFPIGIRVCQSSTTTSCGTVVCPAGTGYCPAPGQAPASCVKP
jgi:hypothetical protein